MNERDDSDFCSSLWQGDRCSSVDFPDLAKVSVEFCNQLQSDMVFRA